MRKKKLAFLTMVAGCMFGGGCLFGGGNIPWSTVLWGSALDVGLQFVTDNDAVFDLFEDGNVTAAPAN